jgi:hypothetical protein
MSGAGARRAAHGERPSPPWRRSAKAFARLQWNRGREQARFFAGPDHRGCGEKGLYGPVYLRTEVANLAQGTVCKILDQEEAPGAEGRETRGGGVAFAVAKPRFNDPIEPMTRGKCARTVRSLAVPGLQCRDEVIMNVDHPRRTPSAQHVRPTGSSQSIVMAAERARHREPRGKLQATGRRNQAFYHNRWSRGPGG